jgi:hypothetical protein
VPPGGATGPVDAPSGAGGRYAAGTRIGAPTPAPFGGTPRAGTSPLGGVSSGGHPPVQPGNVSLGGGTNRLLWIAAGVLAVVGVIALILLFGQGGGDDDSSGTTTSEATSTTAEASGYNATIEANFMNSCTADAQPGEAACQCIYDKIEATVPFDRFVEIDQQLTDDPSARPPELIDIFDQCTSSG